MAKGRKCLIAATLWSVFGVIVSSAMVDAAPHLDKSELFNNGRWRVVLSVDADKGDIWCSATTRNRAGQSFDLTVYDSGRLALFVTDSDWDLGQGELALGLDLDGRVWRMQGHSQGKALGIVLPEQDGSADLLSRLTVSRRAALLDRRHRPVALFPLQGSAQAFVELFDCADKISADNAKPAALTRP